MTHKNKIEQAADMGQSIWLDHLDREFIHSGKLQALVDRGLRGITSNPSIFQKAIAEGREYDEDVAAADASDDDVAVYEALAIADIQHAADMLAPVFIDAQGMDGFISLEANPNLAYDTEGTIKEVRRLHTAVNRPNVMFKVPATAAGIPAIAALIEEGININITLMFSLADYDNVADAYMRGLEARLAEGLPIDKIASVASFFVSRVDTAVDEELDAIGSEVALSLKGKIGIANAKMAYARYLNTFSSQRWQNLARHGARTQRILYGSTSVKNPDYPDTMYVDNLMGANTINTLPLDALEKFAEHGTVSDGLTNQLEKARQELVQLAALSVNLERITQQLQDKGVTKFADAFNELLGSIKGLRDQQQAEAAQRQPEPLVED